MNREEFIKKIFKESSDHFLDSSTILPVEDSDELDTPLTTILGLNLEKISQEGKLVIDILENDKDFPYRSHYQRLKWNILAIMSLQDIFSGTIYNDYTPEGMHAQNYFYYEGLHLIREYFYTGFNNFLKASDHLVRTILEFNIRQCYFNHKCAEIHSFKPITDYLQKGVCPSNQVMINHYLEKDSFSKPIKVKIQTLIQQLSNSSSHASNPDQSIRGNGKMHFEYTIDSIFFWLTLNGILPAILWSYYLVHPMLLHPKDIISKFGYNFPLGLLVSHYHFDVFKKTLDEDDLETFLNYTSQKSIVKDLTAFFDSQQTLSKKEIEASWGTDDLILPDNIHIAYTLKLTKMRAIRELLANRCTVDETNLDGDYTEHFLNSHSKYSYWKKNYTIFKS